MANIITLTSLDAPELDVYARLTQAQLRNRLEPGKGLFIAESPKVIGTALDTGLEPVSFLMEQRHITGDAAPLLARFPDVPVYTAEQELLARLTGYTLTRGVLCAMRRPAPKSPTEVIAGAKRIAVLEGVVDATNIGAIFRSAAALGMDAVLLSPTCCDPLTRRAVRVSMGTVFQLPWATFDTLAGRRHGDSSRRGLSNLRDGAAGRFARARGRAVKQPSEACHRVGRGGRRPCKRNYRRVRLHRPHPHGARRGFSQRRSRQRSGLLGNARKKKIPPLREAG